MKTLQTTLLFLLLPFLLHSQWQETDYGFISEDSTYGNIKFDKNFDAITFESNQSMSIFYLSLGEIVSQKSIDNEPDSNTVTTYDLKYQYQMFTKLNDPGIKNGKGIQAIKIFKKENNKIVSTIIDTLQYEYDGRNLRGAVNLDFKLVEDSLLIVSMGMLQYGEEEMESDVTFIYNLESKSYYQLSGRFYSYKDYSPSTGMIFIRDYFSIISYNPDTYYGSSHYRFYKWGESKSKYYNRNELNLKNIVLPNISNNLIVFSDNGYFLESFDSDDRLEQKTTKYLDMNAKFSQFDDFLILHDNTNSQNVFHILNYENNKILETIQLDYNLKLNFIKHKNEFLYCRGVDGKILKIYVPFFDTANLLSDFRTDKNIYFTNEEIEFYDKSSGYPSKWVWDFGDGKFSTSRNPKHIYSKPGLYTISLMVENEKGLKDTIVKEKTISIIPNLKADFDYDILTEDPFIVQFNNKSQGDIVKYIWNFGDGELSNSENPSHTFKNGIFDISLTVYDGLDNVKQKVLLKEFDKSIQADSSIVLFTPSKFNENSLPTSENLAEVEFFNEKIGLIISNSGEIFNTNDGGLSWNKSDFDKTFVPTRLHFLSNGDAIISGKKGILLKSFDYGRSWFEANFLDSTINITDFDCSSPHDCFLIEDFNAIEFGTYLEFKDKVNYKNFDHDKEITKQFQAMDFNGNSYLVCGEGFEVERYQDQGFYRQSLFTTLDFKGGSRFFYENTSNQFKGNYNYIIFLGERYLSYVSDYNKLLLYQPVKQGEALVGIVLEGVNENFRKFYGTMDLIAVPTTNGNIYIIDSISKKEDYSLNFRINTFKISNSPLFDYHQISPDQGIAIGESGKYYITDFTTDIETIEPIDYLKIYPNPTTDEFTIVFKEKEIIKSIKLYDLKGYEVYSKYLNEEYNIYDVKISKLQKGTYFLKITTDNDIFHKKIIKF